MLLLKENKQHDIGYLAGAPLIAPESPHLPRLKGDCDPHILLTTRRHRREMLVIHKMTMRTIALVFFGLILGGCAHELPAPGSQGDWSPRDKLAISNLPFLSASIPERYRRQLVDYPRKELPGTIVVDSDSKFLYYVLPDGKAIRYGVTLGEEAQSWSGVANIGRKEKWPPWVPTAGEQRRLGPLPAFVPGGPDNPMGARGLYLYSGSRDTLYRIHGTNQPKYIGQAIPVGCIRMTNEDAIDLYNRVKIGTFVVILAPTASNWQL